MPIVIMQALVVDLLHDLTDLCRSVKNLLFGDNSYCTMVRESRTMPR